MNKKIVSTFIASIFSLMPILSLAAFDAGTRPAFNLTANDQWLTNLITGAFTLLWSLFIAFAIIMFIVAGFQFLSAQGEPDNLSKARKSVLWGVVGVVMGFLAFLIPFIVRNFILVAN